MPFQGSPCLLSLLRPFYKNKYLAQSNSLNGCSLNESAVQMTKQSIWANLNVFIGETTGTQNQRDFNESAGIVLIWSPISFWAGPHRLYANSTRRKDKSTSPQFHVGGLELSWRWFTSLRGTWSESVVDHPSNPKWYLTSVKVFSSSTNLSFPVAAGILLVWLPETRGSK